MNLKFSLALLLLAGSHEIAGLAQEQTRESAADKTDSGSDAAGKIDFYRRRLQDHRLFTSSRPDQPCQLVDAPLMRFDNPVSRIGDGMMFLWTDGGRPVAALKSYDNLPNGTCGRTFVSLATEPLKSIDRSVPAPTSPPSSIPAP